MHSISVPTGYSVSDEYFGWQDDQSGKGLWLVFGIGLALILLTVAMVFDWAWGATMVFLNLPLALAGVAVAFWATGPTTSSGQSPSRPREARWPGRSVRCSCCLRCWSGGEGDRRLFGIHR